MLKASNLRKQYSNVLAVDGVSFEVGRGQVLGLLGPNGAGKTTSIRIILNILQADSGVISYDGLPFTPETRNHIGYLPEERGLYRKSRVLDTILYFAQLRGMSAATAKAEAYQWLSRFKLLDHTGRKIEELSKGNQQKVQFISSVIHDPLYVVLDEPYSGLDPVNQMLFTDAFMELKQRGKAVIFSTHQMDAAEKLSDHICLINAGKVVLKGSVRDIKKQHGRNSVHLEFDGDGAFLKSLEGVGNALVYENSAELELLDGVNTNTILSSLLGRIDLRKFEIREPSLHSIFLQSVNTRQPAS